MKRDEKHSVKLKGGCLCQQWPALLSLQIYFQGWKPWRVGLGPETQPWSFTCTGKKTCRQKYLPVWIHYLQFKLKTSPRYCFASYHVPLDTCAITAKPRGLHGVGPTTAWESPWLAPAFHGCPRQPPLPTASAVQGSASRQQSYLCREAPHLLNALLLPFTIRTKNYTFLCISSMLIKQSKDEHAALYDTVEET